MSVLHVVAPHTVRDWRQPSGGNVYDRELVDALRAGGQVVREHLVRTEWVPGGSSGEELAGVLDALPDGSTVLVDGLVGLGAADVLSRAGNLRLWLLVHLPLALAGGDSAAERRSLCAAAGVVTTSRWTRDWLLGAYGLDPARVVPAVPGARAATPAHAQPGSLLCVGAVVPAKGQHVLLEALGSLRDLDWSCRLVGPLDRDPAYVARVRAQARELGDRVTLTGALRPDEVGYGEAGLLVLPTLLETYGMVVTEALAHGVPVVAGDTGGVAEALGVATDGRVPGVLVPPGDSASLAGALRRWLTDRTLRARLRDAAADRRQQLTDWSDTARIVRRALEPVAAPAHGSGS